MNCCMACVFGFAAVCLYVCYCKFVGLCGLFVMHGVMMDGLFFCCVFVCLLVL